MSDLPRGWEKVSVTEIVALHDSRRVPLNATQRAEMRGPIPYYGANGLVDHVNDYLFDGEYVLLAEDGGYFDDPRRGVAYEVSGKFWVNNHAHILEPLGGIQTRFVRYQLNAMNWLPYVGGSTRLKLTQGGLQQALVPVPPLAEQRRIVAKIDSLTRKSKRARDHLDHIPRLVEKYKQAILAAAFRGDLTQKWREIRGEGSWRDVSISDVSLTLFDGPFGSNLKSSDYTQHGIRVVRLENIGHLHFIREKQTFVSERKYTGLTRHTLQSNDILVSSFVADEMRVCLFPHDLETVAINKADCFCIRPDTDAVIPKFVELRLASSETYKALEESVHGATRPRISLTQLRSFRFDLPPREEQAEIVRCIESAFIWVDRLTADTDSARRLIDHLDQALLAKAFRGELVPQDPADEPASALLDRIRAERATAPKAKRGRKKAA